MKASCFAPEALPQLSNIFPQSTKRNHSLHSRASFFIINADKIILTGNKLNQKVRYYHTGWVGGIKEIHYNKLMAEEPEKAVMYAVNGMLPNNTIGRKALTRLRVYKGTEHDHQAQNPIAWTGEIK